MYLLSAAILVAGLSAGAIIYVAADDEPQLSAASAYLYAPGQSKVYVRDLQRFGGKSAVLFDELIHWFEALWQGKRLGLTVAWISAALSAALFFTARLLRGRSS